MRRVLHKCRTMKKCYCCGPETHMLNNYYIIDTIARYKWFDRTVNVQSHSQQASEKRDEQTVGNDVDVNVSSTKTSSWGGLQISLNGIKQVT